MPRWSALADLAWLFLAVSIISPFAHAEPPSRGIAEVSTARDSTTNREVPGIELEQKSDNGRTPVVSALALQPDGKLLASAGDDHLVRIWNPADGRLISVLRGHRDWVRCLTFNPNSAVLASAGDDGEIITWNVQTGAQIAKLRPYGQSIYDLTYSPDGSLIAAVGFDKQVHLYSTPTARQTPSITTPCGDLRSVCFSPDGRRLAVAGSLGLVVVCDVSARKTVFQIQTSLKRVRAAIYSPDGQYLITAGEGRAIEIWDTETGQSKGHLLSRPAKTHALTFCGDRQIATGGADNIIHIWNLAQQIEVRQLQGHVGSVEALVFAPATSTLVSGGFDTSLRVWRLDNANRQETAAVRDVRGPK